MILKNTAAVLILGLFVGIASNLGLIGSQSYLLSHADAVYAVYGSILGGLLFSFFLKHFCLGKVKYARFAAISISALILVLALLAQDLVVGFPKAIIWYLIACFGFDLLRWIVSEITVRHLDPARAQSYFSYLNAFLEGGTVIVILALKFSGTILNDNQTLWLIVACCIASLLLILFQFLPSHNFEIVYSERSAREGGPDLRALKPLVLLFILVTSALAVIEVSEDYLVKVVVKSHLQTYDAIRAMTENYFSLSCVLIALLSLVTGKAIELKRISPIRLLNLYALLMAAFSIVCLVTHSFYLFVLLEVVRRVSEYCLYSPANQMVISSFVSELRPKLKATHSFYYYALVPILMAAVFSLTTHLPVKTEVVVVLVSIIFASLAALVTLVRFRQKFTSSLYDFINSQQKAVAVIAANMLSYIRPPDYVERMNEILAAAPKKLLRKTIILGLGYLHSERSVEIIKEQFESDKEEIQLAALDALRISKKFRATQFMLNILLAKATPKTQRVRLNAMSVIAGIYGKKAIPFLMNGLEDADPRVVANALEVLSYFKDRDLKPYFVKHLASAVPRVRANALLGLAHFRETKSQYRRAVLDSLEQGSVSLIASIVYVIGRLRDREFRSDLIRIYDSPDLARNPALVNVLSWALIRINDQRGYELTNRIVLQPTYAKEQGSFMHFFSLHPQEVRYDIIRYFVNAYQQDPDAVHRFGERLKQSIYDFHEELEYLKVYSQSIRARGAGALAETQVVAPHLAPGKG